MTFVYETVGQIRLLFLGALLVLVPECTCQNPQLFIAGMCMGMTSSAQQDIIVIGVEDDVGIMILNGTFVSMTMRWRESVIGCGHVILWTRKTIGSRIVLQGHIHTTVAAEVMIARRRWSRAVVRLLRKGIG